MNIKQLIKEAHENAVEKGFYDCHSKESSCFRGHVNALCKNCNGTGKDQNRNIGEMLMLIVSELGEVLEAHRKGRFCKVENIDLYLDLITEEREHYFKYFESGIKDTFEDEIADVFIRLFDLCGYLNLDIEKHIHAKMEYNKTRPYKHEKEY
jgi:NTP pyrophosphatase (non-canonical NTP hydrolase)